MRRRRAGRAQAGRSAVVATALSAAGVVALLAAVLAPAAPGAARMAVRLAAAVHAMGRKAHSLTPAAGRRAPAGPAPAVGALFTTGPGALRVGNHFCTASVVDSPGGNVVMTAAHCVSALAPGQFVFVPGFRDGVAPYGIWTVTRVIVDLAWSVYASPDDDVAFLLVSRPGMDARVQSVTGGERLGIGWPAGAMVRVTGYPDGALVPVSCQNRALEFSPAQLQFDCPGYANGTSGSPLLADVSPQTGLGTVIGVIGGYQLGGLTPSVSYAARLGADAATLYQLAIGRS